MEEKVYFEFEAGEQIHFLVEVDKETEDPNCESKISYIFGISSRSQTPKVRDWYDAAYAEKLH
jgi:hypothetical protein